MAAQRGVFAMTYESLQLPMPGLPRLPDPESFIRYGVGEEIWSLITANELEALEPYLTACSAFAQFTSPDGAAVMGND